MSDEPNPFAALSYSAVDTIAPTPPEVSEPTPPKHTKRQIIVGAGSVVLGAALVLAQLVGSSQTNGAGAYNVGSHFGQVAGWAFGFAFLVAGAFAVRKGLRARRGHRAS
jgi:hypothetical protein